MNKDKIQNFAKENGYIKAIYKGEWKEYEVYEPIYSESEEVSYIGYPLMILVKDDQIRLTTPDESLELLNIFEKEE